MSSAPPIKILHLVDSLGAGGMENGIVNVSTRLNPDVYDIHVCCLTQRGAFAERMPRPEQVRQLGKEAGFSLRWVSALKEEIQRISPDLLHTHNLGSLIYGSLATRFGGFLPIVHGEHAQLNPEEVGWKRRWQRKILYQTCAQIHTVSDGLKKDLEHWGLHGSRVTSILNGVDGERFFPVTDKVQARAELALPLEKGGVLLGIVGRLAKYKGHLQLLEAFDQLSARGEDLRLLIVGSGGGHESAVLDRISKSSFENRIHWAGGQKKPELYLRAMDLMVFPSVNEGLSNAVLESMSCETPVLANEACGNNEVIVHENNGFLTRLQTSEDLADAIQDCLQAIKSDPDIAARARKSVLRQFSMTSMVKGYQDLYLRAIG